MFNKVILTGHLTRAPELKYTKGKGTAVAKAGMATNRKVNVNGEMREEVCFIDLTFWGRYAEVANQYLDKGSKVMIEGRLMFEQWQDANGQSRSKHSVVVESMEMLGANNNGKNNSDGNAFGAPPTSYGKYNEMPQEVKQAVARNNAQNNAQNGSQNGFEIDPDEIPF